MSRRRIGACGEPGPSAAHCTEEWDHQYSCYDASEDVSFNDRQEFVHDCGDRKCPHDGYRSQDEP